MIQALTPFRFANDVNYTRAQYCSAQLLVGAGRVRVHGGSCRPYLLGGRQHLGASACISGERHKTMQGLQYFAPGAACSTSHNGRPSGIEPATGPVILRSVRDLLLLYFQNPTVTSLRWAHRRPLGQGKAGVRNPADRVGALSEAPRVRRACCMRSLNAPDAQLRTSLSEPEQAALRRDGRRWQPLPLCRGWSGPCGRTTRSGREDARRLCRLTARAGRRDRHCRQRPERAEVRRLSQPGGF